MRTSVAILCFLGLAAAGCGAEPSSAGKFDGQEAEVAEAIEEIQTAGERGEAAKLCRDLFAKSLREQVSATGSSCDKEIEKAIEDADAFSLEVTKVRVTGTTATADIRGKAGKKDRTRTFALVKEDGRWRVSSFSAGS
jgi:hypothetical protein